MTSNLPVFSGEEPCRWCERVPPAVWSQACLDCALDRDNLMQPRRPAPEENQP